MKIRDKFFLVFGLYLALAIVFSILAYKDLGTISTHLRRLEISDDITNSLLEVRRYEKNYLLYRDPASLEEIAHFLASMTGSIQKIRQGMTDNIGPERMALIDRSISDYERLIGQLGSRQHGRGRGRAPNEQERADIERIRMTAREIQVHVEANAQKERAQIDAILRMSAIFLAIGITLLIVFGPIINIRMAKSIVTPIQDLERITKKIAQGDFAENIPVKGHDEIASLGQSFNQMEQKLSQAMAALDDTIKKLQEKQSQLVEAEKLASLGKLAAGIAHEINNPLTSVLTFSNLMLEQCPPSDPRHDKLKLMARETERARNIVRQLLNFGRESVIRPVKININQPVTEITESLVAQEAFKGIELTMKLADDLPAVYADPAQLGQVVLNILLNAIHAITPPGRIDVATRREGSSVEIVFADTGKGIAEEHLHKIFDPFFTTKDATRGTGLGLAVSYGIIKKHGGDIAVESSVGKGTTFTVRLPVYG